MSELLYHPEAAAEALAAFEWYLARNQVIRNASLPSQQHTGMRITGDKTCAMTYVAQMTQSEAAKYSMTNVKTHGELLRYLVSSGGNLTATLRQIWARIYVRLNTLLLQAVALR